MTNLDYTDKIRCPECNALIPITETLHHQLTEAVRREFDQKTVEQDQLFAEKQREINLKQKDLEEKEKSIDAQLQKALKTQLEEQKKVLSEKAKQEARDEFQIELKDLRENIKVKEEKLEQAQEAELALRRKERDLEQRIKDVELEVARKIDAERKLVERDTIQRYTDEQRMKDAEKEKQISDMRRQIDDLKRRAEQGSQQSQGEVQELELENEISQLFPTDVVHPVPKGMQGADLIQEVLTSNGSQCGTIIWESKRTKNWSDGWISKLKDDQRTAKANIAVIVTQVLPKEVKNFGFVDGVWITNYSSFQGLSVALRQKLFELFTTRAVIANKDKKADILIHYLAGSEFRQRVEAIVEAFTSMKMELDKERRVYERSWSKREKQLQLVLLNTAGMYGDLQGMIGSSMQTIPLLEEGQNDESNSSEIKAKTANQPEDQAENSSLKIA